MTAFDAVLDWARHLDSSWLFLLVLPVVVVLFGLWSGTLRRGRRGDRDPGT